MIRPRNGQTVTVTRTVRDLRGNPTSTTTHTIERAVFWWDQVTTVFGRRQTSTALGNLGVPRGSDLRQGDDVTLADGKPFITLDNPEWDQDHPLSGHNFGYMVCKLQGVT